MTRVLDEILDSFYTKLSESEAVNEETINALRSLFASGKKPKADDFVAIFEKTVQEVEP